MNFFCSGIMQNVSFFYFLTGIDKVIRRHVWKKVEMSGDCRKAEDSVLFSIYTPAITVSLTSKYDQ